MGKTVRRFIQTRTKKQRAAWLCFIITVAVVVCRKLGVHVTNEEVMMLQAPFGLYLFSQGMTDWGAGATKDRERRELPGGDA